MFAIVLLLFAIASMSHFPLVSLGLTANSSAPALEADEKPLAGPAHTRPGFDEWMNASTRQLFPKSSPCPIALSEALNEDVDSFLLHFFSWINKEFTPFYSLTPLPIT